MFCPTLKGKKREYYKSSLYTRVQHVMLQKAVSIHASGMHLSGVYQTTFL